MWKFVALTFVLAAGALAAQQPATPSPWAYGFDAPAAATPPAPAAPGARGAAPAPDTSLHQLPGSTLSFTLAQIRDGYGPADWFPGDHPQMPEVVAHGKKPAARACSLCHYPNGKGRPENAGVSGLPASYFIQQLNDFRNGSRKSAEPRKANTNAMIDIAKALDENEIKEVAEYFASIKWTPWIK